MEWPWESSCKSLVLFEGTVKPAKHSGPRGFPGRYLGKSRKLEVCIVFHENDCLFLALFEQGWLARVCLALAPCHSSTVTLGTFATMQVEMINPTGSQLQHLSQWCLWQKKTLSHISVAARSVRPQLWQLLSTARKLLFLTALKAGAVCGSDIPSLWYWVSRVTFCAAMGFKFECLVLERLLRFRGSKTKTMHHTGEPGNYKSNF